MTQMMDSNEFFSLPDKDRRELARNLLIGAKLTERHNSGATAGDLILWRSEVMNEPLLGERVQNCLTVLDFFEATE